MNKTFLAAAVFLVLCPLLAAQVDKSKAPKGTVLEKRHSDGSTEVQPDFKSVRVTPDVVQAAQQKLDDEGYNAGTPDGKLGPATRGAIRKYQSSLKGATTIAPQ